MTCLSPPERARRPRTAPPRGAVDSHAHVFGPFAQFPLTEDRPYTPPELPGQRYLQMLDEVGIERGVLVQPVAHGTDCRALLHALERAPTRLRGIALLTSDVTDQQLQSMHERGVRGARFSRPPPGLTANAIDFDVLRVLAPRLKRLGWHAQIWAPCDELVTLLPNLCSLGLPLIVDHMGAVDVTRGVGNNSFQTLLRLLDTGHLWIKTVAYRISHRFPDYEDVEPYYRAMLEANPERLLWGSDWPHVHMEQHMPDVGYLLDLLERWTPDEIARRRILVDNPVALYGF